MMNVGFYLAVTLVLSSVSWSVVEEDCGRDSTGESEDATLHSAIGPSLSRRLLTLKKVIEASQDGTDSNPEGTGVDEETTVVTLFPNEEAVIEETTTTSTATSTKRTATPTPKPASAKSSSNLPRLIPAHKPKDSVTTSLPIETTTNFMNHCSYPAYHEFPPDLFTKKQRAHGAIVVHLLVVLYMFYALAVVCDDYFIASLEECSARLNLSDDVAGATFMAAGSSAPELFTAILGVFIAKGDVGVGTIVGSAVFNILFVIGLCSIFAGRVVALTWWPLLRDSSYYAFTVIVLILIILDSIVTWYESLIMLILYAVYIILMKYNSELQRFVTRQVGKELGEEPSTSMGILAQNGAEKKTYSSYVPFNDEIDDYADTTVTSEAIVPADESIKKSIKRRITFYEAGLIMMMSSHFRPITRFRSAAHRIILENIRLKKMPRKVATQSSIDPNDLLRQRRSMSVSWTTEAAWKRIPQKEDGILHILKWVVQAPLMATLHYTIPDCKQSRWSKYFVLTFFMSVLWTAIFSYIMVWMVTLIGFTIGVPDTIMGITFLAAGTSVPDAFASIIVAKQGQGDMAVSNSIGSNVFDILVGLALPWFIQTAMVEPGSTAGINSHGMVYSVILLFLTIIITIVGVHYSGWHLTPKLGVLLISVYLMFVIFSAMLEFNVLGDMNPPMCPE